MLHSPKVGVKNGITDLGCFLRIYLLIVFWSAQKKSLSKQTFDSDFSFN